MNRVVWKYTLVPGHVHVVRGGALRVVHVAVDPAEMQRDPASAEAQLPTVWVELDPLDRDDPVAEALELVFIGTGHPVPEGMVHLGSCVTPLALVWHVYGRLG